MLARRVPVAADRRAAPVVAHLECNRTRIDAGEQRQAELRTGDRSVRYLLASDGAGGDLIGRDRVGENRGAGKSRRRAMTPARRQLRTEDEGAGLAAAVRPRSGE